jgi:hypothetical protein
MSYEQDYYKLPQKPGELTAVAIMTLISGFTNIGAGITWSIVSASTILGILCVPLTILPAVFGVYEIIYAANLLANPPKMKEPSQTVAIIEIGMILTGNVLSLISGILSLVFYSNANVQAYFAHLRGEG